MTEIKRNFDGIAFNVLDASKYRKKDKDGKEFGEELDSEPTIMIIGEYGFTKVTALFCASLFQAILKTDPELKDELDRRLTIQKAKISLEMESHF